MNQTSGLTSIDPWAVNFRTYPDVSGIPLWRRVKQAKGCSTSTILEDEVFRRAGNMDHLLFTAI
jgi:hypothetical protein